MNTIIREIGQNKILLSALLSWLIAQSAKVALGIITKHRFDFRWFIGTGGMPSSHCAFVAALAASVGIHAGFNSTIFAITCVFALITIFDAQVFRRNAGIQASILNRIVDDVYFGRPVGEKKLMELLGHTPIEALVGTILGIAVAILCK